MKLAGLPPSQGESHTVSLQPLHNRNMWTQTHKKPCLVPSSTVHILKKCVLGLDMGVRL